MAGKHFSTVASDRFRSVPRTARQRLSSRLRSAFMSTVVTSRAVPAVGCGCVHRPRDSPALRCTDWPDVNDERQLRLPTDNDRIARPYYDVAMITAMEVGSSAKVDIQLLDTVRNHNLVAFQQVWRRFDEAVPGSLRLVPQAERSTVTERDQEGMQGMILGEALDFGWVTDQLRTAEAVVNGT